MTAIRAQVHAAVTRVARQRGLDPARVTGPGNLVDNGLKSLDLSRIVALLEVALDMDPFLRRPITDVRSFDDLCAAYEAEAEGRAPEADATSAPPSAPARETGATPAARRRAARREGARATPDADPE